MISKRIGLLVILVMVGMLVAACQPVTADDMASALAGQAVAIQTPVANETTEAISVGDGAVATVTARSLRVRAQPSANAEVVAGIREGEQYAVVGRSSDGLWLELAVPRAAQGRGWVSSNFVTVSGSIADVAVAPAPVVAAPTPVPTAAPAEEAAEAAPTEVPAEEATEAAPTEVPAEEATEATPTEVPAEEATEAAPTEVPAEEAAEATPTETPAEEVSDVVAPAPGFALVIAEGARLRVRAEPSTDAEIVGWLQPGETVPVEEVSGDGLWVKVSGIADTENLSGGWVLAEFVVLGQ